MPLLKVSPTRMATARARLPRHATMASSSGRWGSLSERPCPLGGCLPAPLLSAPFSSPNQLPASSTQLPPDHNLCWLPQFTRPRPPEPDWPISGPRGSSWGIGGCLVTNRFLGPSSLLWSLGLDRGGQQPWPQGPGAADALKEGPGAAVSTGVTGEPGLQGSTWKTHPPAKDDHALSGPCAGRTQGGQYSWDTGPSQRTHSICDSTRYMTLAKSWPQTAPKHLQR